MMHDGERGFLPDHAPMVANLGIGVLRLHSDADVLNLEIEGGFVEVSRNRLIVLAEEAMKQEELSEKQIRMELADLADMEKTHPEQKAKYALKRKKLESRLNIAMK
ncbi:MAG TPA: F0F1 ATP synthase subunit epsilon, partial [Spirochaetota bacterium]|nr:F0F1 ATP synthase subunit epsilon [Spirochaetota bacterium]